MKNCTLQSLETFSLIKEATLPNYSIPSCYFRGKYIHKRWKTSQVCAVIVSNKFLYKKFFESDSQDSELRFAVTAFFDARNFFPAHRNFIWTNHVEDLSLWMASVRKKTGLLVFSESTSDSRRHSGEKNGTLARYITAISKKPSCSQLRNRDRQEKVHEQCKFLILEVIPEHTLCTTENSLAASNSLSLDSKSSDHHEHLMRQLGTSSWISGRNLFGIVRNNLSNDFIEITPWKLETAEHAQIVYIRGRNNRNTKISTENCLLALYIWNFFVWYLRVKAITETLSPLLYHQKDRLQEAVNVLDFKVPTCRLRLALSRTNWWRFWPSKLIGSKKQSIVALRHCETIQMFFEHETKSQSDNAMTWITLTVSTCNIVKLTTTPTY